MVFWYNHYIHCFICSERFQSGILKWEIKFGFNVYVYFKLKNEPQRMILKFSTTCELFIKSSSAPILQVPCIAYFAGLCGERGLKMRLEGLKIFYVL